MLAMDASLSPVGLEKESFVGIGVTFVGLSATFIAIRLVVNIKKAKTLLIEDGKPIESMHLC